MWRVGGQLSRTDSMVAYLLLKCWVWVMIHKILLLTRLVVPDRGHEAGERNDRTRT